MAQASKAPLGVVLLSGGNPQIAKGEGDAPVQAYIHAMPEWKRDVGRRLDALIVGSVPNVRKAVKWNSPFYGIDGQGWFLSFHVFTRYVKLTFFRGAALQPMPPGASKHKSVRYLDIHEHDELDEDHGHVCPVEARVVGSLLDPAVGEPERPHELALDELCRAVARRIDVVRPALSQGRRERVCAARIARGRAVRVDAEEEPGLGTVRDPRPRDVAHALAGRLRPRHHDAHACATQQLA